MYYNFLHTDPYEHVGKIQKKRKGNIYTSRTHPITKKRERKKETHPSTFLSIYMKKLINEVSGERIVC